LLAVLDDPVRLHSPRDAVAAADDALERRGLCVDGLHFGAEQTDRRKRHDERADAAEGENAQSRRIYRPLSRCNVSAGSRPQRIDQLVAMADFPMPLDSWSSISGASGSLLPKNGWLVSGYWTIGLMQTGLEPTRLALGRGAGFARDIRCLG